MISIILVLFLGILFILPTINFLIKKIFKVISKKKLKMQMEIKCKKELERDHKLAEIDKANKDAKRNDQIFMERRVLKAWEDSNFDLFYDEEKILHQKRLEIKNQSKWKGIIYYSTKKGDIYFISLEGNKIYLKKVKY